MIRFYIFSCIVTDIFIDCIELASLNQIVCIAVIRSQSIESTVFICSYSILSHIVIEFLKDLMNLSMIQVPYVAAQLSIVLLELG